MLSVGAMLKVLDTDAVVEQKSVKPSSLAAPNTSLRNEVQRAVDKGAAWITQNQNTNGFWSTADHPALTGLALMALQGPNAKRHQTTTPEAVTKGYSFLMRNMQPDGGIYSKDLPSYNTSISLLALTFNPTPESKEAMVKARKFLIGLQAHFDSPGSTNNAYDGGISYGNGIDKRPDLSNTSWALEALHYSNLALADKNAGETGDLNWAAAIAFIQRCQNLPGQNKEAWASDDSQNKGGFIYSPGRSMAGETNLPSGRVALRSYGTMSYAGLLSYIYADMKKDDPRVRAVMDWLQTNYTLDENPGMGPAGLYYYFHTLTKALNLAEVNAIETKDGRKVNWREDLTLKLLNLQKPDGSWTNDTARWFEKDAILTTSYALITLEMLAGGL